jgi:hypothetical protein
MNTQQHRATLMRAWTGRRLLPPRTLGTQVWLARAAAAVVLSFVAADLIRVMWTLPWPVDAVLAVLVGAAWSVSVGGDRPTRP